MTQSETTDNQDDPGRESDMPEQGGDQSEDLGTDLEASAAADALRDIAEEAGLQMAGDSDTAEQHPPYPQQAEEEIADLKDQLLRARAESENIRRRADREREDTAKYAVANMARDMLNVADNLRRALESIQENNGAGGDAVESGEALANFITGVDMTERELLRVFEQHKIKPIDPLDEKFDHNLHQAMCEIPDSGKENGTVVQVMQRGFVIADRLLRPAMVGVAKGGTTNSTEAGDVGENLDTKA